MRVLLTDGSGLTARQVATQLGDAGHEVHALSPDPWCLARFTRRVARVWPVPRYGDDPLRWLDAALDTAVRARAEVLFPTQEQVAVLAARPDRLAAAGVRTAVPSFDALRAVQDKVSAWRSLDRLGVPQPAATVLATRAEAEAWDAFPVYLKQPIGTASSGVWRVGGGRGMRPAVAAAAARGAFDQGGVLAQEAVSGRLVMAQAVFDEGALVASHTNLRVAEGPNGGACHKRSISLAGVRHHLAALGAALGWHGGLSADVVLAERGALFVDVNPRLVEPGNARLAGVDLVGPMLDLAVGGRPVAQPAGRPGVATHQLLLGVLGAAERVGTRRAVLAELSAGLRHLGEYAASTEELTPVRGDLRAVAPVAAAAAAVVAVPRLGRVISRSAVRNYAMAPAGWQQLLALNP